MRLHTYMGRKVTAKSHGPAGKGDTGRTEIPSEKTSRVCQNQNYSARVPETSTCKTPNSQRRRLHFKQCLLSTSEEETASRCVLKWEHIAWKAWLHFSVCSGC